MTYYEMQYNPGSVSLNDIPELDYNHFYEQTLTLLKKSGYHCLNYFIYKSGSKLRFIILVANDDKHVVYVYSHLQNYNDIRFLKSLSKDCFSMHVFEREMYEVYGIDFIGNPWLKPLRFSNDRYRTDLLLRNYPFYQIESEEIHEVGVGPIHAGVIEPGHFRFICHGENVLHLEIQLGYQHRGVEKLLSENNSLLKKSLLSESIAGDTSVGHGLAFSQCIESLSGNSPSKLIQRDRVIALEMERIAVHIGDTAALCGDVGYQLGQVTCEALRTVVINTTQDWCGNRFGKGLVRPGGTNFPVTEDVSQLIVKRIDEVKRRYLDVTDLVFNNSGIITRFENTGTVTRAQAIMAGAVGMAARASGLTRDIRASHPSEFYGNLNIKPVVEESGDVFARGIIRRHEVELSYNIIKNLLTYKGSEESKPDYDLKLRPDSLSVSLVEGWRGEICHSAVTDEAGTVCHYKVKDPSLHNWMMLALAVRGQEISDFPLCNKSFNLSYCGHDL